MFSRTQSSNAFAGAAPDQAMAAATKNKVVFTDSPSIPARDASIIDGNLGESNGPYRGEVGLRRLRGGRPGRMRLGADDRRAAPVRDAVSAGAAGQPASAAAALLHAATGAGGAAQKLHQQRQRQHDLH